MNGVRIINAETILRDGTLYLHYTVERNGSIKDFERPYYDKDGDVDPEVQNILLLAKKHLSSNEETKEEEESCKNLVVYQEPSKDAKVSRNYASLVASGLAGVLVGIAIMAGIKGCTKSDVPSKDDKDVPTTPDEVVSEEETKINYMTEEEYLTNVQILCKYFNEEFGFQYQPKDLNSFYYFANMENIPQDLFDKLVMEGYIPDTDVGILQDAFAIISDLKTKGVQSDTIDFEFDKMFVDKRMIEKAEYYQNVHNKLNTSTKEEIKSYVTEMDDFMTADVRKGYNLLPVGGRFIFGHIVADVISVKAYQDGICTSEAFDDKINDLTQPMFMMQQSLDCMVVDATEKQLTK